MYIYVSYETLLIFLIGTPIQIQRTGKVAGSRSFGDSIKRHIFNKGLLNKTPKKGSGSSINTVEEVYILYSFFLYIKIHLRVTFKRARAVF